MSDQAGDELFAMPEYAYTVDVIAAWTIRYWVQTTDPEAARRVALEDVVHRYRAVTQRSAVEVTGVELLGDHGVMPGWVPHRRDPQLRASSTQLDHPVYGDDRPKGGLQPADE